MKKIKDRKDAIKLAKIEGIEIAERIFDISCCMAKELSGKETDTILRELYSSYLQELKDILTKSNNNEK